MWWLYLLLYKSRRCLSAFAISWIAWEVHHILVSCLFNNKIVSFLCYLGGEVSGLGRRFVFIVFPQCPPEPNILKPRSWRISLWSFDKSSWRMVLGNYRRRRKPYPSFPFIAFTLPGGGRGVCLEPTLEVVTHDISLRKTGILGQMITGLFLCLF